MKKAGAFRRMDMTQFAIAFGGMFVKKSAITSGGASFLQSLSKHAYPAGASFCADKRMQKRFRAAP